MMTFRIPLAALALLAGCSDPFDDRAKGQSMPTHSELSTRFAAGSAQGEAAG